MVTNYVRLVDYKVWQQWITKCVGAELQSALGITMCGRVDYKVRQGLQSVAGLQSELVHVPNLLIKEFTLESFMIGYLNYLYKQTQLLVKCCLVRGM